MDQRMIDHLEAQLVQANATNLELRARVESADRAEASARATRAEAVIATRQLEQAHARQKAAENAAASAQRKQLDAEREARSLRAENEELHERLKRAYADVGKLAALNERVRSAQRLEDLLVSSAIAGEAAAARASFSG